MHSICNVGGDFASLTIYFDSSAVIFFSTPKGRTVGSHYIYTTRFANPNIQLPICFFCGSSAAIQPFRYGWRNAIRSILVAEKQVEFSQTICRPKQITDAQSSLLINSFVDDDVFCRVDSFLNNKHFFFLPKLLYFFFLFHFSCGRLARDSCCIFYVFIFSPLLLCILSDRRHYGRSCMGLIVHRILFF